MHAFIAKFTHVIKAKLNKIFPQPVLRLLLSFQTSRGCMLKSGSVFCQIYKFNKCSVCPYQQEKQESQKRIQGQNDHLDWCGPSRALEVCKTYYLGIQDKFSLGVQRLQQGSGALSWGASQLGTAQAESSSAASFRGRCYTFLWANLL